MRNRTEDQIKLVLIRHGATEANKEHRYLGRTDESLCEQAKEMLAAKTDCYPNVDLLFTSPMKRCMETAEILYPDYKPIIINDFREMDFGDFEGKNYKELNGDPRYQAWIDSGGTIAFPNGESREEFVDRCRHGMYAVVQVLTNLSKEAAELNRCKSEPASDGREPVCGENQIESVGLVVHGGTIMALCSAFGGGDYFDYQVKNGEGYVCHLCLYEDEIRFEDIKKLLS